MCEERKWKKDIHIQLANMKYTDSCIEILQNSDLGREYFSDYEKAANMLTYAVGQENIYDSRRIMEKIRVLRNL